MLELSNNLKQNVLLLLVGPSPWWKLHRLIGKANLVACIFAHICSFLIRSVFNLGNDIFFGSLHEHECPKLLMICKPQDTAAEMHQFSNKYRNQFDLIKYALCKYFTLNSGLNSDGVSAKADFPEYFKRVFACDFQTPSYFQDNLVCKIFLFTPYHVLAFTVLLNGYLSKSWKES